MELHVILRVIIGIFAEQTSARSAPWMATALERSDAGLIRVDSPGETACTREIG